MSIFVFVIAATISACRGATLGETMWNASALVGDTATFFCVVEGTQVSGENLKFNKVINGDDEIISLDYEVIDSTKYSVSGKYNLEIKTVTFEDEGEYNCNLDVYDKNTAYLSVGDAPSNVSLWWSGPMVEGEPVTLTCEATQARPPATFRWYHETTEVTADARAETGPVDASGYGWSASYLTVTPSWQNVGDTFTCHADVAGVQAVASLSETLSSAPKSVTSSSFMVAIFVLGFLASW